MAPVTSARLALLKVIPLIKPVSGVGSPELPLVVPEKASTTGLVERFGLNFANNKLPALLEAPSKFLKLPPA
jgi:hypothetical protein